MAQDQVDEVKQKTDIVSVIGEKVELKKAGRNYKGLCPFHSEKTPSFMVSPELQIFKCFGCQESGDVISFLEKYEGMEFYEALKFLADKAGVKLVSTNFAKKGEKEKLYDINNLASRFYNYILLNHKAGKAALDYLIRERGISTDSIKTFQLGYSPNVPFALNKFLIERKKNTLYDLENTGLVYRSGGSAFDRFRGRIVFPLFDHRGNICGFAGRTLPEVEKMYSAENKPAKYINTPETRIYKKSLLLYGLNLTKSFIKKEKSAVIVEGELDLISSWQAGIKNLVAIKGSALTGDQLKLLGRFCEKLILALDSDIAGDTAARRGISTAQSLGFEMRVARLGGFKDPDEAARKGPQKYKNALNEAVGVWDFIIDSIFSKYDLKSGEDKAKISREIIPVLSLIPDLIVKSHYIELVSRKLGVLSSSVSDEIDKFEKSKDDIRANLAEAVKPERKSRKELLEERLLSLYFQSRPEEILRVEILKICSTNFAKRLIWELERYFKKRKTFSARAFMKNLPGELKQGFSEISIQDTEGIVDDPEKLNAEVALVVRELKVVILREKLSELSGKIRGAEIAGDRAKVVLHQRRFKELTDKLTKLERNSNKGIILS